MRYSQRVISPFLLLILVINVTALAADAFLMLKSESQEDYKSEATDRDLRLANSRYNSVKRSAQSFGDKVNFNDDTEPPFSTKSGPGISVLGGSSGSWADISFRYRKNITISSSKDLTNFPVLVDLYDTDLQKYARVDAWDIMFTNTSGTKLPHEIEHYDRTYNSTHAHLVAWVMANLSSSQNTIVSMYFGNPITANQENPEGVWDSNYVMVHHMNEDPTTTIYDSTSKENNAAANGGMTSGDQVAGMMNGGIDFDGNDDYLTVPDDASLNITGEITLEAWVYYKGYDVGHRYAKILHKPLSSIIDPWNVYSLALDDTMGDSANLRFEISNGSAGSQEAVESTSIVALNGWTHVVATYNGATMRIYINGVDENQNSASIIIGTNNNPLQIGSWDIATDNRWYGILDELRISNVARSADWIVTSWNNQNDPASFYSIGQKEVCPDTDDWAFPIMKYRKNITIAASEVAADLIDFPVLIDLNDSDLHDSNKVQADGDDILFTAEDDWRWSDELLTNGGFDLGDLSGWVTSGDWNVGTDPPQGGAGTQAGSFCAFVDSTSSSSDYLRQDVDISSYGVDIDAGKALASVSGWLVSAESGSDDSRIRVEYLNSLKNVIATPLDSGLQSPSGWTQYSLTNNFIPANTRYIRVWATCYEDGWDAGSVDSFSVRIATLEKGSPAFKLDHEIEFFDQTGNGTHAHLIAWVRIPSLSATTDTNITMYYGNSAIRSLENPAGVWGGSYAAIWHLNDDFLDSTINANDGTNSGSTDATAKIADGQDFDGNNDYVNAGSGASLNNLFASGGTISAWIHPTGWGGGNYGRILDKSNSTLGANGWGTCVDDVTPVSKHLLFYRDFSTERGLWYTPADSISLDQWQYVVITYDESSTSNNPIIYINGVAQSLGQDDFPIGTASNDSDQSLFIGNYAGTALRTFDGIIDEVRLSNGIRSAAWITTEYNNQQNPASFCSVAEEETYSDWWVDGSFSKRKDIVIDNTKVAADLTDYPLLIDLTQSDLKSGDVQPDADDILFVDANGTKLAHEIEYFNQTSSQGHLVVWVRVPTLFKSQDTVISMYYGNDQVNSQENPTEVWDSNYKGVWHLGESGGDAQDSTFYGTSGILSGGVTQGATGQIDGAYNFDGVDDEVDMGDPGDGHLDFGIGSFTVEVWVYKDSTMSSSEQYGGIFKGNGDVDDSEGWLIRFKGDGMVRFSGGDGTASVFNLYESSVLTNDKWDHYVGVLDRSAGRAYIYKNGQIIDTDTTITSGNINSGVGLRLARDWQSLPTTHMFKGLFDEIRLSNIARSSDWIATQYNNQNDPASFYSVGPEIILDTDSPVIENFGIDDPGNGNPKFWASVSDSSSQVASVTIAVNSTNFAMSLNATGYWIYAPPAVNYGDFLTYQIVNASDLYENYLTEATTTKGYTLTLDLTSPDVLNAIYDPNLGVYGTFKANVTDSWGAIDTVIVNVTEMDGVPQANLWAFMQNTTSGYLNDTIDMVAGIIWYNVTVNDSVGNIKSERFQSSVPNHAPVAANLRFSRAAGQDLTPIWSNSTLYLRYDYIDRDNDIESVATEIRWYRNDGGGWVLMPGYNDSLEVPTSELIKGHQWNATVKPHDGQTYGLLNYTSTIAIIGNSQPSISNVVITFSPSGPYTTSNITVSSNTTTDPDAADSFTYFIEWYNNATGSFVLQSQLFNKTLIEAGNTSKGEAWYCRIRVWDGSANSTTWATSNMLLVINSIPIVKNPDPSFTNPSFNKTNNVIAGDIVNITYVFEDFDGDSENLGLRMIKWYRKGVYNSTYDNAIILNSTDTLEGTWWQYEIIVHDGMNYSIWYTSNMTLVIGSAPNTAPVAYNLTLALNLTTIKDIVGIDANHWPDWYYYDDDGDQLSDYEIRWYLNGVLQKDLNDSFVVDSSLTLRGQEWNFTLQVFDGRAWSALNKSNTIKIRNSIPVISNVVIWEGAGNPFTTDTLSISNSTTDADGDSLTFEIEWYWNGQYNSSYYGILTIHPDNTTKGESWHCRIRAWDGFNQTDWINSTIITIANSPPIASNLIILIGNPKTEDDLVANWTYYDADGDPQNMTHWEITWYNNTILVSDLSNSLTVKAGNTTKGQLWYYTLRVFDSQNYSIETYTLIPYVQILNTAPIAANYTLTSSPTTNDDLVAAWDSSDADGDLIVAIIRWYRDNGTGWELQPAWNDLTTIPASVTSKGEAWNFTLQVHDGGAYSIIYYSPTTIIRNTPPTVTNVVIYPYKPFTNSTLTTSNTTADVDGDAITSFEIRWYKDDIYNSSYDGYLAIYPANTTKGESWYCEIRAYDGENYSSWVSSAKIWIYNSAPTASNVILTPIIPFTNELLILNWTFVDIDGDNQNTNWMIHWEIDGQLDSRFDNQTAIGPTYTTKGDKWQAFLWVFDGTNYSIEYSSSIVVIQNTPAMISLVEIYGNANQTFADVDLDVTWSYIDLDGDIQRDLVIFWYRNNVYQADYDNQTMINSSELVKGQIWFCVVQIFDGEDWSQNKTSQVIVIINKPPEVPPDSLGFIEHEFAAFLVEDEDIKIAYIFADVDHDNDSSTIRWYKNGVHQPTYDDMTIIPSNATQPGDVWYFVILPFDGTSNGTPAYSQTMTIESRPQVVDQGVTPQTDYEGHYVFWVRVTDARNNITEVKLIFFAEVKFAEFNGTYWVYDYTEGVTHLGASTTVIITATATVSWTAGEIPTTSSFDLTIEDCAPPRVLEAVYTWDEDDLTNITFFVEIEELGSGVAEVILYYYFRPGSGIRATNATTTTSSPANGSQLLGGGFLFTVVQNDDDETDYPWQNVPMHQLNTTHWTVTVPFNPDTSVEILFKVAVTDNAGNRNPNAFPLGLDPTGRKSLTLQNPEGLDLMFVLGLLAVVALVFAILSIVAIRKWRTTELVGLDKERVLGSMGIITKEEIRSNLDQHTLGIVVSLFDQRHGPVPIIIIPDLLKDNFDKLVELSDQSFSNCQFLTNFEKEVSASFDFILGQTSQVNSISFAFALSRPEARGGAENITLNMLVHTSVSPLVGQFVDYFSQRVHEIHVTMDKEPSKRDKILKMIEDLRQQISCVVLSYERLYGTTELISEELDGEKAF